MSFSIFFTSAHEIPLSVVLVSTLGTCDRCSLKTVAIFVRAGRFERAQKVENGTDSTVRYCHVEHIK